MDFSRTFAEIEAALRARGVRLAVVGGVALAAYGHARTTVDLDLVTEGDAQERVVALMESLGFQTLHRSTGYSNHLHHGRDEAARDQDSPERLWQDMADVAFLVRLDGVDRDKVRDYFEKAHLMERWRELEAQQ